MKLRLIMLAGTAALAACQAKTQQSVENQFQQTQAGIENSANAVGRAATGRPANTNTTNSSK
jgi:hypothetical protein